MPELMRHLAHYWHVWTVSAVIVLIALDYVRQFIGPAMELKKHLARVNAQLAVLAQSGPQPHIDLTRLKTEVMASAPLQHAWLQYANTLQLQSQTAHQGPVGAARQRVSQLSKAFFSRLDLNAQGSRMDLSNLEQLAQNDPSLAKLWAERSATTVVNSPQDAIILAGIVEKETGQASDRGLVAGVFSNRLRIGMRLQTDPTVIYGITKGEGVLGRGLRQSELRRETPWNTYVIDGLPPTPIANPGRLSIEAALNPDKTDFLYFVADGSGGHVFAKTLAEHNENVAKWREIEAVKERQRLKKELEDIDWSLEDDLFEQLI